MPEKKKQDIVYAVTNPAMPDWVKIGISSGGEKGLIERIRGLYRTNVPLQFKLEYAIRVENARAIEGEIKRAFKEHRRNPNREFYKISSESATSILKIAQIGGGEELRHDEIKNISDAEVPKNELRERDREEKVVNERRSNFKFSDLGIATNEVLVFKPDETKKATVIAAKKIAYGDEGDEEVKEYSVSRLAKKLLGVSYSVNGSLYWIHKGETLDEIRRRKEEEELDELAEE